jgi:putative transposase
LDNRLICGPDGRYTIDFDDFEKKASDPRARLFLLCSPHNPTGRVWTREELEWMSEICLRHNVQGLMDKPGRGAKPKYSDEDRARIVQKACEKPEGGYTSWSQRRIAKELGMSQSTVQKTLKEHILKPHKVDYWCGKSTDPEFEAKMLNVIGLYLNPDKNAMVLSVDEKTQIQALDRSQPELPLRSGNAKRLTATYKRNGTVSLIAALAVHHGEITAQTIEKNNHENFLNN